MSFLIELNNSEFNSIKFLIYSLKYENENFHFNFHAIFCINFVILLTYTLNFTNTNSTTITFTNIFIFFYKHFHLIFHPFLYINSILMYSRALIVNMLILFLPISLLIIQFNTFHCC